MANWKTKTPRNAKYVKWIGSLSCLICGNPDAVAHHTEAGGMGIKGSDYSCLPLCHHHHDMMHRHYSKSSYWNAEELAKLTETFQQLYKEYGK